MRKRRCKLAFIPTCSVLLPRQLDEMFVDHFRYLTDLCSFSTFANVLYSSSRGTHLPRSQDDDQFRPLIWTPAGVMHPLGLICGNHYHKIQSKSSAMWYYFCQNWRVDIIQNWPTIVWLCCRCFLVTEMVVVMCSLLGAKRCPATQSAAYYTWVHYVWCHISKRFGTEDTFYLIKKG